LHYVKAQVVSAALDRARRQTAASPGPTIRLRQNGNQFVGSVIQLPEARNGKLRRTGENNFCRAYHAHADMGSDT